jgi:hypothetical protein
MKKGDVLIAVYEDQNHAVKAMDALRQASFGEDQLGLATRKQVPEVPERVQVGLQHEAADGAASGAAVGAGLGVAAGVLVGALLPIAGVVVVGGLLTTAVTGAALGAMGGAVAGPFVAMDMSEDDAQLFARHVAEGRTVVLVHARDREDEAETILDEHGAYDESMKDG